MKRPDLPFFILILALMIVCAVVLSSVLTMLMPTAAETALLFVYMIGSALVVIGGVYLLLATHVIERFTSLRWTLLSVIIVTVAFVLVNVFVSMQLMLINESVVLLISALLLFGGVVAILAALLVSRALIRRIEALGGGLRKLTQGELDARLDVGGRDELAELAHMFNHMMGELAAVDAKKRALDATRRDLVAWASHDLRAPLAALHAMNEAILDGVVQDEPTVLRYRQSMQREIVHMGRLISDLFELAEMDAEAAPSERSPVQLDVLINEVIDGAAARIDSAKIALRRDLDSTIPPLLLSRDKIARVLHNLLDNALQHTPPGGEIVITLRRGSDGVEVGVRNSGSYIAPTQIEQIFERFYRSDSARAARGDGQRSAGLGLAIARGFAEAHGGRITVTSDRVHGTEFTLWLPA
jgi:two-component system, OmpR family, sensor histidine kinase SaeS